MDKKLVKILEVLEKASCPCPLGYITIHTNIINPKLLEKLVEEGYVQRMDSDNKSSQANYPLFSITEKARHELRQLEAPSLYTPLKVVAQKLVI